jgi:crossover junction endodeoxyribonuclease RuvC
MRILGIDPGTATTGFGVIEIFDSKLSMVGAGVISTLATADMPSRLITIHQELEELVAEFKPDQAAVELLYFAQNVTTAMTVGQARGVIILTLAEHSLPISEFTPLQVKQAVAGYGKATKSQVQSMVQTLLGLKTIPKPDDAADALAIAITAAHSLKLRS